MRPSTDRPLKRQGQVPVIRRSFILVSTVFAGACASASPPPRTEPIPQTTTPPVTAPPTTAPVTPPSAPVVREAAVNWQLLDQTNDAVLGIGLERAMREVIVGKQPARTVVVAVIDGGIDTAHVDLRANLWRNPKETAGNNRDDDNNGYVDDVWGWNFIGGRDGKNVHHDTYEVTRLHALCQKNSPQVAGMPCDSIARSYEEKKQEAEQTLAQINMIKPALEGSTRILKQTLNTDSLTVEKVRALRPMNANVEQAKSIYMQLATNGITPAVIEEGLTEFKNQLEYGLNLTFEPRPIVGDNYADLNERRYGNRDVTGPDAKHGTHVAGIIGAVRGNNIGMDGVAAPVKLMAVRAVPDGDERDKDVANAIRYAVDQGAHIINMSFGKAWSPQKPAVDAAVQYANSKGVLIVHAAGNEGENLAVSRNFPTPMVSGQRAPNWIEVGASTWRGADTLAASFSNYGKEQVDVFAPGEDILSTVPGGGIERQSGTSMAAPVVTGLAALILAYYPTLTPADVRRVIMESSTKLIDRQVIRPGGDGPTRVGFGSLSVTGGVVNAVNALRLAEQLAASKK